MAALDTLDITAFDLVSEAVEENASFLSFNSEELRELKYIPPSIARLTGLKVLDLEGTSISDLTPLSSLQSLEVLNVAGTNVSDISPLEGLEKLNELWLDDTKVLDLNPLRELKRLINSPSAFGLQIRGCSAFHADNKLQEISNVRSPEKRIRSILNYLDELGQSSAFFAETPDIPSASVAPLQADIRDGRMFRARPTHLPGNQPMERARMGWEAIKLYRDSFETSFNIHNHAPLPSLLNAFDRAMGGEFDPKSLILIGIMGSRIVNLSSDQQFLENLPTGADTDLKGFAAHISTFLNRFPDWLTYQEEAVTSHVTAEDIQDEQSAFDELAKALSSTPEVDDEVSVEYALELVSASDSAADNATAIGFMASNREVFREFSEKAIAEVKSGRIVRENIDMMDEITGPEVAKAKFWMGGFVLVFLKRQQQPLRHLAMRFPSKLGWLNPVLDWVVGNEPKTDS